MTPFLCSVHTHATLCDGKASPEEMAAAAYEAGVKYYGFSCHSHTPIPLDEGGVLPADMTAYRDTVFRLREQYAGKMEILLGLEWDSCADVEPEGFDYWIGSVHYQRAPDGSYYTTDWDDEKFLCCLNEGCGGDVMTLIERYYEEAARVAAKKPTILGHFDGIVKLNAGNKYFDEDSSRYRELALTALHSADPAASLLEINTGACSNTIAALPIPPDSFWRNGEPWAVESSSRRTPMRQAASCSAIRRPSTLPRLRASHIPYCLPQTALSRALSETQIRRFYKKDAASCRVFLHPH